MNSRKLISVLPRIAHKQYYPAAISIRSKSTTAQTKDKSARSPRKTKPIQPATKSFVMNMYRGHSVTEQLIPFPSTLDEEQVDTLKMLVDPTEKFFEDHNDPAHNDELEKVAEPTMQGLREMGAFGLMVPTEYGGLGCNNTQYARLVEIVGSHDLGVGITLGAHQSIGFKGIMIAGTPEQKQQYLPKCATGEQMAAFALTEPGSGSDANSIRTRAVPSEDGSHYIMNGAKIWISNGGIAEVFTVFAQSPVTDEATGKVKDKVTAFIVERAFGGISNGAPNKKMGIKASNTTEVYFDNVKIPKENVLGGVGKGFKVAMEILNNGRFGMAAALTGTMRTSINKAVDFAVNRTQFGAKITTFGTIQEKLARMAMLHYVTESMAYLISNNMDAGSQDYHLEAAISKVFGSEAAWHVTDEAIQVMGGMGFMKETGLERVVRDLRIFRIFEGTNDILRLLVSLAGIQYGAGTLTGITDVLSKPSFAAVGTALDLSAGIAIKGMGFTKDTKIDGVHKALQPQADDLASTVANFSLEALTLMAQHKSDIINKQFQLNRLANATIELYTAGAVLSRATRSLELDLASAEHEKRLARVWVNEACQRARYNIKCCRHTHSMENYADMAAISGEMCAAGGIAADRVLGF